ncbi:unnamed protein product, partial [marine sediment metagenome]
NLYGLGYQPWLFEIGILILAIICFHKSYYASCLLGLLIVIINLWQAMPYQNFWNILIDPLLVIISLGFTGYLLIYKFVRLNREE